MKFLKRTLSILLMLIILIGTFSSEVTSDAIASDMFTDVANHWATDSIGRWDSLGFIDRTVFSGEHFLPNQHITRIEFFSLLVSAMGASAPTGAPSFTDVTDLPDNLRGIVAAAHQMGIAQGRPDGTMHPHGTLLRQDAATLAARAVGKSAYSDHTLARFSDSISIADYARAHVAALVDRSLLSGFPDGTFRPNDFLTRAEAVRILDNIFANIFRPEAGFSNVYLQGTLLTRSPNTDLRDSVIDGDFVIGDGVGSGQVIIADTIINGRLVVRGGGSNSVTLSNTTVTEGIFVASFAADTRISITNNSYAPILEAVSGFTLSGSGVAEVTILENARNGSVINLTGVHLLDLNIDGSEVDVRLNSGHVTNARFDAGQGANFNLAANTSVDHLTISAPNASVTGLGNIHNALITASGTTLAQTPELLTLGNNITAMVSGQSIFSPETQWPNSNIDRISAASNLQIELLRNINSRAPFDQTSLTLTMISGRAASEVHVSQAAANRVPLTQRGERWGYWIGFFVPAPLQAGTTATITHIYVDGAPITLPPRHLDTHDGRLGLLIYLPVFVEPGRELGTLRESLHINWGGHITDNILFTSSTMHLAALTALQRDVLQRNFDNRIMYSISQSAAPYTGAEATRRILASDNPLGVPNRGNRGLDAINRAVSHTEARSILEDQGFSQDLTIDTSLSSQYSALSAAGRQWIAEQLLTARRTIFANPAAVRTAFDRSVQQRLAAETALLSQINSAENAGALRRIIETATHAAILQFQTGAEPYSSFTNAQKDQMAQFLWNFIPYRNIQQVVDAIRNYLRDPANQPGTVHPNDAEIVSIAVTPNNAGANFAVGSPAFVSTLTVIIRTGSGANQTRPLTPSEIAQLSLTLTWRTNPATPVADARRGTGDSANTISFNAIRQGNDFLTVAHTPSGRSATITVSVRGPIDVTGNLSFRQRDIVMREGDMLNLWDPTYLNIVPANATTIAWSSTSRVIADVSANGIVTATGRSQTPAVITVTATNNPNNRATVNIWVIAPDSDYELFIEPTRLSLQAGSQTRPNQVRVLTAIQGTLVNHVSNPLALRWSSLNPDLATVDIASGIITATNNPPLMPDGQHPEATIEVRLVDTSRPSAAPLASAQLTVVIRPQIDYEVIVVRSVIENRGRDGQPYPANFLQIYPIASDYVLPETFVWQSSNPVVLFTLDNGRTSHARVETPPGAVPRIMTDGIGRSSITVRANSEFGPEVAEPRYIISAPRGISMMEFDLGRPGQTRRWEWDNLHGRVMEIAMNSPRTINIPGVGDFNTIHAVEPGQPPRDMSWSVFEATPESVYLSRQPSGFVLGTPTSLHLSYSSITNVLQAQSMGLAHVVFTPSVVNPPPGWGLHEDPRGRWFGTSGRDIPFFVLDAATDTQIFNPLIDEVLSGLQVRSSGSNTLSPLNPAGVSFNDVQSGHVIITDVNGVALTRAGNANPTDVWLVVKTADSAGSNEFFAWIMPAPPAITLRTNDLPARGGEISLSTYMRLRETQPNTPAIVFAIDGGFAYRELFSPDDSLLPAPLQITAWTFVNDSDRETGGAPELVETTFRRYWGQMPAINFDPNNLPPIGFRWEQRISAQVRYTTNAGFRNLLNQGGLPREIPPQVGTAATAPVFNFTVVNDLAPQPIPTVHLHEGDSGSFMGPFGAIIVNHGIDIGSAFNVRSANDHFITITGAGINANFTAHNPGLGQIVVTQDARTVTLPVEIIAAFQIPVGTTREPLHTLESVISVVLAPATGLTQAQLNTASFTSSAPGILAVTLNDSDPDPLNHFFSATGISVGIVDIRVSISGIAEPLLVRVRVIPGANAPINPLGIQDATTSDAVAARDRIPVTSVSVAQRRITLRVGQNHQLNPIITPADATNQRVTYATRNNNIATVNAAGVISARRVGSTTITITVDGRSVSVSVRVIR
ncbi:MAG: S-layer homology domain-containing protein [Oscillospiraceae bacterium]|nr:S-layer homology domain-containing protein [Oscillospiraceae bacterium]